MAICSKEDKRVGTNIEQNGTEPQTPAVEKRESEKGNRLQVIIPLAAMAILVIIMLLNYMGESIQKGKMTVADNYIGTASDYRDLYYAPIKEAVTYADYMSTYMIENSSPNILEKTTNDEISLLTLRTLEKRSMVYQAVAANNVGQGFLSTGEQVSILNEPYYANSTLAQIAYYYVEAECVTGRSAIVSVVPIKSDTAVRGYLYLYFDPVELAQAFVEEESTEDFSYIVLSGNDQVIWASEDATAELIRNHQFSTNVYEYPFTSGSFNSVMNRLSIGSNTNAEIKINGHSHYLFGVPIGIDKMYLIMEADIDRVNSREYNEWSLARRILGWVTFVVCVFVILFLTTNLVRRKEYEKHSRNLVEKAETDLLTQLYNKIATEQKIQEYVEKHKEEQGVMMLLDIDNFKKINDTMGHAFGDEVMRAVGKGLRAEFRYSDILGRMGGDEFVIFLKGLNSDAMIQREAGRLVTFFRNFTAGDYVKYSATASIGAAVFPADGDSFEILYHEADKALYTAKRRGKNQLAFYKDSMEAILEESEELEESVRGSV